MNNLNLYSETVSGYTAVSDLFIDEYVPSANGDFVKVYLYRHKKGRQALTCPSILKHA